MSATSDCYLHLPFANTPPSHRFEVACEPNNNCNVDQLSFKAYLSRWMAATTKVAPWTADQILPLLASSAQAAAQSCSGGDTGNICGTKWTQPGWDGTFGVGQQMSALEVIQSNLIKQVSGPVSNSTGGTSKGNPSAGTGTTVHVEPPHAITTGDKAGAGVLTAVVLISLLGGGYVSFSVNPSLKFVLTLLLVDVSRLIRVGKLAFWTLKKEMASVVELNMLL
jgi:hypothetical protein